MRNGATLAIIIAVNMALSGAVMPTTRPGPLMAAICGDPSRMIRIPMQKDDDPGGDCPSACHAMCARRAHGENDE